MSPEEGASRSISRVLSRGEAVTVIPLGRSSPNASSNLPGSPRGPRFTARSGLLPYLVLLRMGFTLPPALTGAVRSYRTISPLPSALRPRAVYFLWHFPWAHAPQALPGTLLCGARTFLRRGEVALPRQRSPGPLDGESDKRGEPLQSAR